MSDGPVVTPGVETSEYKLTRLIVIVGSLVAALGSVLEALASVGLFPRAVGIGLVIVGALTAVLKAMGYESARVKLKVAEVKAIQQTAGLHAVAEIASAKDAAAYFAGGAEGPKQ